MKTSDRGSDLSRVALLLCASILLAAASARGQSWSRPLHVFFPMDPNNSIVHADQANEVPSPGSGDVIILQDGFEDGKLSKWHYDGSNTSKFTVATSPAHGGSHSLQVHPALDTTHLIAWLNCPSDTNCPGYDEIYVKYYTWWAVGDSYDGHQIVVAGNRTDNRWNSFGKSGLRPSGTDFFYAGIDPESLNYHGNVRGVYPFMFYTYWPGMSCPGDYHPPAAQNCWGNIATQTGPYGLVRGSKPNTAGVWHEVVYHIKMNSIGASDGLQEMWVDGTKVVSQRNMQWRTSKVLALNMVALEYYFGQVYSGNAYVDDVSVWTPKRSSASPMTRQGRH